MLFVSSRCSPIYPGILKCLFYIHNFQTSIVPTSESYRILLNLTSILPSLTNRNFHLYNLGLRFLSLVLVLSLLFGAFDPGRHFGALVDFSLLLETLVVEVPFWVELTFLPFGAVVERPILPFGVLVGGPFLPVLVEGPFVPFLLILLPLSSMHVGDDVFA